MAMALAWFRVTQPELVQLLAMSTLVEAMTVDRSSDQGEIMIGNSRHQCAQAGDALWGSRPSSPFPSAEQPDRMNCSLCSGAYIKDKLMDILI